MRNILVFFIGILIAILPATAQAPKKLSSSEAFHALQKLNFLGSALYIAAHPDDENTRLISYLSNDVKARTGYLSITRGDGGQNLIGPELRELLGVLRTQELLAARRIDGGQQFFTRANDFGYSKHPKETLKLWDKASVLSDVVWVIRNFKPDVIINRFDHRTAGSTHGHHTSSAILSTEAFDLAGNATIYPEHLSKTATWQPRRLFFNTSWWFYGSRENFEKADKSNMLNFDTGVYYPLKGLSNNEIASLASSQHLCQGFGRLTTRGSEKEYIELLKGDLPQDENNIFDGIDTSWSRVKGGAAVGDILYAVADNFNFSDPSQHLPELLSAYTLIQKIEDPHWRLIKTGEIEDLITAVTGLYLEASADFAYSNPGNSIIVNLEALNRSNAQITLKSVKVGNSMASEKEIALAHNTKKNLEIEMLIPEDAEYSSPYWLAEKGSLGMYKVDNPDIIGSPETARKFFATFELEINGTPLHLKKAVIRRYSRPDKGELYQPFEVLPEASSRIEDKVIIFSDSSPKQIPVTIKALKDNLKGEVQLCFSEGWKVDKEVIPFEIINKGEEKTLIFTLTPPEKEDENYISPIVKIDGKELTKELISIAYDHIPTQSVLLPSEAKVVRLNIQKAGEHIGYIAGAGDKVPESLEQIGYIVHTISPSDIQEGSLDKYDAVVMGIRAYNVLPELKFKQDLLFKYVHQGGNLIVQYNTAGRWDRAYENIAPFPLKLSRDRVTNENSPVEIIAKDHALVNFPNPIEPKDFEGWVQERGLYFPSEWDPNFTPILSMNDEDETATKGSLLVSPYGKGHYIYTGLSFFRELPAGVSGAYKIFANMLSIGKDKVDSENDIKG
ncbi:PIG-L family deacetylase [Muriicola sp. Z0-33]|uniref:PIG-L family deacetylase n=1 Tax=Muriicola sp. Z0-33 TaxID=2816957 RepID=UPI002237B56A|nr:PIG-L family deacetylase [Muriicola sp. Z0-33]MCW5515519.1 PIG-L family deacetylase [Muriicola sp. Z0-33]